MVNGGGDEYQLHPRTPCRGILPFFPLLLPFPSERVVHGKFGVDDAKTCVTRDGIYCTWKCVAQAFSQESSQQYAAQTSPLLILLDRGTEAWTFA